MKRYLQFGTLLAAGLFVAGAHAANIVENVTGNITVDLGFNPTHTPIYTVSNSSQGNFTDIFKFDLTEAGPTTAANASYSELSLLNIYGITDATFGLYTNSGTLVESGLVNNIPITPGTTESVSGIQSGPLTDGRYYYKITGDSVGSSGSSYQFSQVVNPVPEPSTYAMMVMGMLGLGYVAYRQARKVAPQLGMGMAA